MPTPDHGADEDEEQPHNHWVLLRDVLAFQLKLGLDGIRDLALTDGYINKVETAVVGQYQKGGLMKDLTDKTDRVINRLQQRSENDEQGNRR